VVFAKSIFVFVGLTANLAIAGQMQEAAKNGNLVLLEQALDQGGSISEPDEAGDPPLVLASLKGHADAVALILARGADIEARNRSGLTALHAAAYAGNLDVVKLLVAKGAAVNDNRNFYHMSPLHAAAEEGHADVAAFLVANKADIAAAERNGYTPLTQAGWRGYWNVGEMLLKAGAICQKAELVGEALYSECMKRKSPG
jgi:ankyrin repeat protein